MGTLRIVTIVISYILLLLYLATTISTLFLVIKIKDGNKDVEQTRLALHYSQTSFLPPLICILSTCSILVTVLLIIGVHKKIYEFIVFWLFYCVSNTIILLALYIWEVVVIVDIDITSTTIHWIALILQIVFFYVIYLYYKEVRGELGY